MSIERTRATHRLFRKHFHWPMLLLVGSEGEKWNHRTADRSLTLRWWCSCRDRRKSRPTVAHTDRNSESQCLKGQETSYHPQCSSLARRTDDERTRCTEDIAHRHRTQRDVRTLPLEWKEHLSKTRVVIANACSKRNEREGHIRCSLLRPHPSALMSGVNGSRLSIRAERRGTMSRCCRCRDFSTDRQRRRRSAATHSLRVEQSGRVRRIERRFSVSMAKEREHDRRSVSDTVRSLVDDQSVDGCSTWSDPTRKSTDK